MSRPTLHYSPSTNAQSIIDAYFEAHPYFLTRHHIESFDDFVDARLRATIRSMNPVTMVRENVNAISTQHQGKIFTVDMYIGGDEDKKPDHNIYIGDSEQKTTDITPHEARLRDLTYGLNVYADIHIVYKINGVLFGTRDFEKVFLGYIPIMLHSKVCMLRNLSPVQLRNIGECPYDQGGYFLIDGRDKVIVTQEERVANRLYIRDTNEDFVKLKAFIRCVSQDATDVFPRMAVFKVMENNAINVTVTHIDAKIPVCILFRALGVESDKSIIQLVFPDVAINKDDDEGSSVDQDANVMFLRTSIIAAGKIAYNQTDAIAYLAKKTRFGTTTDLKNVLTNDLFPNVGRSYESKALLLASIVRRLITTAFGGEKELSVLDNYENKRLAVSGSIVADMFRDLYLTMRDSCIRALNNEFVVGVWRVSGDIQLLVNAGNMKSIIQSHIITEGLKKTIKGSANTESVDGDGIVQDLNRVSYLAYISHIRRVNNPVDRSVKLADPHRLRATHWGILCPVESPDGPNIGLLNHLATLCIVSLQATSETVSKIDKVIKEMATPLQNLYYDMTSSRSRVNLIEVYLNDTWVAVTNKPKELVDEVRRLRRKLLIQSTVGVSWNIWRNTVHIRTDRGRCCRPLVRLDNRSSSNSSIAHPQTWDELLKNEVIELIDVEEIATCMVAMSSFELERNPLTQFTHQEIHAASILSIVTNTYPMLNHNHASYNVLGLAQFKQAIGTSLLSFRDRMDTYAYSLHHPQRPMVSTNFADKLFGGQLAYGENLVVAIATYTGYNQEDSIILNIDAVQRGRLSMTVFETLRVSEEEEKDINDPIKASRVRTNTVFANPSKLVARGYEVDKLKRGHHVLDDKGMPKKDAYIGDNMTIVGMVQVQNYRDDAKMQDNYIDVSQRMNLGGREKGYYVDSVYGYTDTTSNGVASNINKCKIRLRQSRTPELGDKLGSRFGQKGVVGMLLPASDMPFCANSGVVPDLILNPNAFPKRMTVAHILESILGRAGVVRGTRYNADTFSGIDIANETARIMSEYGLSEHSDEIMHNGRTGEEMTYRLFVGISYYGRYKHMVEDKYQFRSTGAIDVITRQPKKTITGESGGLRIGEMEQNAILAHGLGSFLKESFMERGDRYMSEVDEMSGSACGWWSAPTDVDVPTKICKVETPYAFKLLQQELQSMSVDTKFVVDSDMTNDR